MAKDALELIDHLGWSQCHVVGISMGGMIALEFALLANRRILSLTLMATHAGGLIGQAPLIGMYHIIRSFMIRDDDELVKNALDMLYGRKTLNDPDKRQNHFQISSYTFTYQYGWHMLNSVGCHVYNQIINNNILQLLNENNNDEFIYYIFERLRRFMVLPENIFLPLEYKLPTIKNSYNDFYLDSTIYKMDKTWINYVRIPWFCFTPTRLIIKPFKFMRSNRVFRYISNVSQSMALVEFRDDTGSAYFSKELVPFLKYYLKNGFWFGNRHYIYLHHAQSQVRQKQFYFYCEDEGKMTRETLESWMGNFDDERLPAKNTARRTQPFSSTEVTIEIDRKLVDVIPDLRTTDGKYNFTDGVGQISSDLNHMIHKSIGINVEKGEYVSSVLQIRYGGCKGTIAINPQLDGKKKQLLIRPSMNKFKCEHQTLELCKRSLRRTYM
ncbi:unnamed protein product [Rotaria sp. Silwood1]|nr:unnamed protein product [Rotaria sp. Silwood1]